MNSLEEDKSKAQPANFVQYNSKDPNTHQIRYYELLSTIFKNMETMNEPELIGAAKVLNPISEFLLKFHFEEHGILNQKSFVKTIETISENIHTDLHHIKQIKKPDSN